MWYDGFINKYKAGISHQFLFHFNIRDLMDNQRDIQKYLFDEFIKPRNFGIVAYYDISQGLTFLEASMEREFYKITGSTSQNLFQTSPSKIFPLIDLALKKTKMTLFINYTEKIIPSGDSSSMSLEERMALVWLSEWSISGKVSSVGSCIFMFSDNVADIDRELLKSAYRVESIMVGLPDEEERKEYISCILKDKNIQSDVSIDVFAKLSSGLSRKNIKDIKLRAESEGVPISFDYIKEKKHSVLSKEYGDVLEFIYPELGFEDIGGMEKAKNYLVKNVVEPIKSGDLRRVPMGVLLCGPSGTGKTLLVNALSKASGFNCVRIDMSRILGQYMGESEKNFKKCLLGAKSQEPVIIFVDEIDTAFQRGEGGDNGVARNIFSEFLQFTGNTNNRGKVIFIAATNRPDLLDPALKRAGRFDKKIPILLPQVSERAEIFDIMIRKYGFTTNINNFNFAAEKTTNYTGAEIEAIVRKAYELSYEEKEKQGIITVDVLEEAINKLKPNTAQVEYMSKLAIEECDDMDLLP